MSDNESVSVTPKYMIGAVTRLTGLTADVVRVWERRYGAVRPARSGGGTRLYSDADILRLKRRSQAVQKRHSIGRVSTLPEGELDEMIADGNRVLDEADPYLAARGRFVDAVQNLDTIAADRELTRAGSLFPIPELVTNIIEPVLRDLRARQFGEIQKRLASWLLRNMLGSLFRLCPVSENADAIIIASPDHERDESELMLAALLSATHGWRTVYLGSDLSAGQITGAVRTTNARVLLLQVSAGHTRIDGELWAISVSLSGSIHVG